jgi:hypothetical protein
VDFIECGLCIHCRTLRAVFRAACGPVFRPAAVSASSADVIIVALLVYKARALYHKFPVLFTCAIVILCRHKKTSGLMTTGNRRMRR